MIGGVHVPVAHLWLVDMDARTVASFDGTEIWFSDAEGSGPVVVLVHGVSMTSISNFDTHFADDGTGRISPLPGPTISSRLQGAGARVIGVDARGHGRSGRSSDPRSYRDDAHARDVACVLDAVGADEVDVVGYSMGGLTAARLLGIDDRLRSVALCGVGPGIFGGGNDEWIHGCGECFQSNDFAAHPEYKSFRAFARLDPVHDFDSIGAAMIGVDPITGPWERVAGVSVLVLNGGNDDGDGDAARLASLIPGAESRVVGIGDHGMAPSDRLFQDELLGFLAESWSN